MAWRLRSSSVTQSQGLRFVALNVLFLATIALACPVKADDRVVVVSKSTTLMSGSDTLGTVPEWAELVVSKEQGEWLFVEHRGLRGWIRKADSLPRQRVAISTDSVSLITLPDGWDSRNDLKSGSKIEATFKGGVIWLMVLSQPKAKNQLGLLEAVDKAKQRVAAEYEWSEQVGESVLLSINGLRAVQLRFRARVAKTEVFAVHTLIEGRSHMHVMCCVLSEPAWEKHQKSVNAILGSFVERPEAVR